MKKHGLITDEWLVSYAAGALCEIRALMVATHVHYHPELQQTIRTAEAIGGLLMADMEESRISPKLLGDTLKRIDNETGTKEPVRQQPAGSDTDLPGCLRHYLGKNLDDLKWRIMGPGMKQVKLATGPDGEKLWLLQARGGTHIPEHDHNGTEMTLVLRGSYHVGGTRYTPGLIEIADTKTQNHRPVMDGGENCICLVATEAPIKLKNPVARMIQPLIGL